MTIAPKWRIFALTLPLTILFGLAKWLFHRQGWELWTFNALTSSLFGAATFIIAFQLNGTLSDYRSSDWANKHGFLWSKLLIVKELVLA